MERAQDTNISVLVAGAGIAGLSFAIEAYRKGHNVRVFERRPPGEADGEAIILLPQALRTPKKWPGFLERARQHQLGVHGLIKKHDGSLITSFTAGVEPDLALPIYRARLHQVLYQYAEDLGIPIEFSTPISDFLETEHYGGIRLTDGRTLTADVVVAADGIGTKSWEAVVGNKETPISSGFVIYRISFPAEEALKNPIIAEEVGGKSEGSWLIFGPDAHIVICYGDDKFCWLLTCTDKYYDSDESWSDYKPIERALQFVEGWTPFVVEVIKATPNGTMLDWKLMWRDPQPKWVSPHGRIAQMGDAAHPFLPTSSSGGTMAMEDAYTLAACLQIAGKENASLATKVYNHLRFERVSCAQKMGFKNREMLHKTDWELVKKHPEIMQSIYVNWMTPHDAEKYAYENYAKCAEHLLTGAPFENTNSVPGHKYKPWTVKELLEASARGEPVQDDGEWY